MYRVFIKYVVAFCFTFGVIEGAWSQQADSTSLFVTFEGLDEKYVPKQNVYDSADFELVLQEIVDELRKDGYWLSGVDETHFTTDTVTVRCYQGRKFDQVEVEINLMKGVEDKMPKFLRNKFQQLAGPDRVPTEIESALNYLEANGYPFTTLVLDSSRIENESLKIQINVDLGVKITYDTLSISPAGLIKTAFLSKYLGLDYGSNYNQAQLELAKDKIRHLPFLTLEKMTTSFQLKKASVHLDLVPQKVNYFNGLLGLVPDPDGDGVVITGDLDLSINNLFQSGKRIGLNWKKLEPGSQQLHASYLHPILLGSPLDFYFALDQVRQDTVFSNRSLQLAFDYRPARNIEMRISYESLLGNKLDDQDNLSGDFEIDYYGLAISWFKLDDLFNPRKGFKTKWVGSLGTKSSSNSLTIPESTQYRFQAYLEWYKPIRPRSVLYIASQSGIIFNDYLYINDLFRLGGLSTIRGFNELEFFASEYTLFNVEWRYYLDTTSYLVAFYDQSFLSYDIINGTFEDKPAALGIGMQFTTDSGNFKILYGLGRRGGEPFSFDTSKIHFGYTAIF